VDSGTAAVAVGFFAFSFLGAEEVNNSEIEPILSSTAVIVFHHFASRVPLSSVPKSICILPVSTRDEKHSPTSIPSQRAWCEEAPRQLEIPLRYTNEPVRLERKEGHWRCAMPAERRRNWTETKFHCQSCVYEIGS
jgi:hypothetical protein